jgi:HK97 family phage major capsid protein
VKHYLETKSGDDDTATLEKVVKQFGAYHDENKKLFTGVSEEQKALRKEMEEIELRFQRKGLTTDGKPDPKPERKALSTFIRSGDDSELKTLSVGSEPDGGYMVLPVMAAGMVKKIFDQSAIARLAARETISVGDAWEEIVDFNEAGASWVGENSARTSTSTPQIGKIRIPVQEIYALLPVTQRLLDDSSYDVGGWVEDKIGDKFGRTEGAAFVSGDGISKPRGFLSYSNVTTSDATRAFGDLQYIKTGSAAGFLATVAQADCLVDMVYKLRAPYKQGDGVAWVMNSTTAGTVRKFKDTTGQFLWQDSLQLGAPPMLLGYPVALDENMPDIGADAFPIAFGNWKLAYKIVDKKGIRMLQDPYTSKPNVLFYAYRRVGGGLANSEAIKLLKCEV